MVTAEINVGRLLELRSVGAFTRDDLLSVRRSFVELVQRVAPDLRVVSITDLRHARPAPLPLADELLLVVKTVSARLDRDATLVSTDPVMQLQSARMLKEAHHDGRKLCRTEEEAIAWLSPTLAPAELVRLRKFLAEGRAP